MDRWGYNDQPIGDDATSFTTDLGKLVRYRVNINMKWDDVSGDLMDQIWAEIWHDYVINESKKGTVIKKGKLHRGFRSKFRSKYIFQTTPVGRDKRPPYEIYHGQITEDDWSTFVKTSNTTEFLELRNKNSN